MTFDRIYNGDGNSIQIDETGDLTVYDLDDIVCRIALTPAALAALASQLTELARGRTGA